MKKILTIILVICSFVGGIFVGVSYEKSNDVSIELEKPIRPIIVEKEMDYFLYGCPNSKKVKRPILKRKFFNKF